MMKSNALNDGFILFGTKETKRSNKGKRIGGAFKQMGRLAYKEMSCRDSDYEMAKVMTAVLDIKIKTFCPPQLREFDRSKLVIVVEGKEFDVIKCDRDKVNNYLYFYLQEVGAHVKDNNGDESTD
ncbi:MAG: phage head-tail adapter protein [Solibacillus isronensis]